MMENSLNYGVYVLFDRATDEYGLPFVAPNMSVAIRTSVSTMISLDDNVIQDFELIEIGQFDKDAGVIEGYPSDSFVSAAFPETLLAKVYQTREDLDKIKELALSEYEELKKLKESK